MNWEDWLYVAPVVLPVMAALIGYIIARYQGRDTHNALKTALRELDAVSRLLLVAQGRLGDDRPIRMVDWQAEHPGCRGPGCTSRRHSQYAPKDVKV